MRGTITFPPPKTEEDVQRQRLFAAIRERQRLDNLTRLRAELAATKRRLAVAKETEEPVWFT